MTTSSAPSGGDSAAAAQTGRYRQRRRTRAAIVDATAELLRGGQIAPGINEIAEAADVSRRTIYQYFPTLDQLILDATLGLLSQTAVDEAIAAADAGADAAHRVQAMVTALTDASADTLHLGRALIRLTVDTTVNPGDPKRGYRRIAWIEQALEPMRRQLPSQDFERLVSALAMVVGWEALIVLQDLRGLDKAAQRDTAVWSAHALIKAALDNSQTNA